MARKVVPQPSLPDQVKAVIWRMFGGGASPLNRSATHQLVRRVLKKHATSAVLDRVSAEIGGWFESHAGQQRLRPEMREQVAALIIDGVRSERGDIAVWAVGSIDADLAADLIRSRWTPAEIDSFVEATLTSLEKYCKRDDIVDASHWAGSGEQDSKRTWVPTSALQRPGKLETFSQLDGRAYELVCYGLRPVVSNLLELVVTLRSEQLPALVRRVEHPAMQARAALRIAGAALCLDHRSSLGWIGRDSPDDLIALAIVKTLNTVNRLDEENRYAERMNVDQYNWSTELRPSQHDLEAAATDLLTSLVDQLAVLDPFKCVRWIGELLSHAPYVLHPSRGREVPQRIGQLEKACTQQLASLARQSWSEDLIDELRAGLRLTSRPTWSRHLAELAWALREIEPARASQIARLTLDQHQRYIEEQLKQDNRLFLHWNDWNQHQWFAGLGAVVALLFEESDLLKWVSERCRSLPLSVWDAEERPEAFSIADGAVQHWFMVALHALPRFEELGRIVDPTAVRDLVEELWAHCRFVELFLFNRSDTAAVLELSAHCIAEFGQPSDGWLLDQARNVGVTPYALLPLIEHRMLRNTREGGAEAHYEETIAGEFRRITSERFGDGGQFTLDELRCWGELWFSLGAIREAEQTAMLIVSFPLTPHDPAAKVVALKLFALVASELGLSPELEDCIGSLYGELWPNYTSGEKFPDRQQIDDLLQRTGAMGPWLAGL